MSSSFLGLLISISFPRKKYVPHPRASSCRMPHLMQANCIRRFCWRPESNLQPDVTQASRIPNRPISPPLARLTRSLPALAPTPDASTHHSAPSPVVVALKHRLRIDVGVSHVASLFCCRSSPNHHRRSTRRRSSVTATGPRRGPRRRRR
jgi:hypothetical protein